MSGGQIIAALNQEADRVQARADRCDTAGSVAGVLAWLGMLVFGLAVAAHTGWLRLPHPEAAAVAGLAVGPTAGILRVLLGCLAARWYGEADELDALADRQREAAEAGR